jgi:Tfp pilus assembly protein PilO
MRDYAQRAVVEKPLVLPVLRCKDQKNYNHSMDDKSKLLLTLLIVLTIISIGYTFYKTLILQDFEVVNTE